MIMLFLILKYVLAWIIYYNKLDPRLGDSTWRFTYDYPVLGERDISDLDDKDFVRLRRKKNKIILFNQKMFYYKLNLFYSDFVWQGTKATKNKNFLSPQWLRNIKPKRYPAWRFDLLFSKKKFFVFCRK